MKRYFIIEEIDKEQYIEYAREFGYPYEETMVDRYSIGQLNVNDGLILFYTEEKELEVLLKKPKDRIIFNDIKGE